MAGRYIWACSHANFMCDGIPAAGEGPVPTKFLIKSTLFQFPIKRFIEFTGALPLARAMDNKDLSKEARVSQNRATFQVAINAIQEGWPVAIYPEGISISAPGLVLPLKPGAAKLAFSAEEANDFSLGLRIIPVGLEYGSRTKVGSGLCMRYGNPLIVSEYRELYDRDPDQAVKKLTDDLTQEMIRIYPHFTDETKQVLGKKLVALGICRSKFDAAQLFLRQLENKEFWQGLEAKLKALEESSREHGIPLPVWGYRQIWKQLGPMRWPSRLTYLILGFPLFLLDLPNNALPEFFLSSGVEFFVTDDSERMSFRFFLSPIVLGVVFALQFWFLKAVVFPQYMGGAGVGIYVLYTLSSFAIWYFAVHWRRQFKRLASLFFFRWAGVDARSEAVAQYRDLRDYLRQF